MYTGMTSTSLLPLIDGTGAHKYRSHVSSGLQSSVGPDEPETERGGYNWRMVVKQYNQSTTLKMICCKGQCNGAPSTVPPPKNGFTQLLYNTQQDMNRPSTSFNYIKK